MCVFLCGSTTIICGKNETPYVEVFFCMTVHLTLCCVCWATMRISGKEKKRNYNKRMNIRWIHANIQHRLIENHFTHCPSVFLFISSHLWGVHYHFVRVLLYVVQHFIELVHIILFFYRFTQLFDMMEKKGLFVVAEKNHKNSVFISFSAHVFTFVFKFPANRPLISYTKFKRLSIILWSITPLKCVWQTLVYYMNALKIIRSQHYRNVESFHTFDFECDDGFLFSV